MKRGREIDGAHCDQCGQFFAWSEFVETIEEYLCEKCASGIGSDLEDEDDRDFWPDYDEGTDL